jgi:hypothetical protein
MINPFKLKGPFGANYSVDGDDILRTKKALHQLGHFEEKEFVNPYADARMIDGLKSFQRSRGLAPDGVMKPDGPTAIALGDALDPGRDRRGFVAGEKPSPRPRHVISEFPVGRLRRPDLLERVSAPSTHQNIAGAQNRKLASAVPDQLRASGANIDDAPASGTKPAASPNSPVAPKVQTDLEAMLRDASRDKERRRGYETQVAGPGVFLLPETAVLVLSGVAAAGLITKAQEERYRAQIEQGGESLRRAVNELGEMAAKIKPSTRLPCVDIADPPPVVPPQEPDDEKSPKKTKFPAEPPSMPKLNGRPLNEVLKNEPLVFPVLSEEIRKELAMPLFAHPGDATTKEGNRIIVEEVLPELLDEYRLDLQDKIQHRHGVSEKEEYMKHKDTGIKGSSFPDFTFEDIRNGTKLRGLTGLSLKDRRTPIAPERQQVYGVRDKSEPGDVVAPLPKLRPGMDIEDFKDWARESLRPYLHSWIGSPK